ncbi:MAG: ATP-binding protein [Candidatus Cloacimonetes bacterium]|jgi:MinD superfamily P-loop ATPase|nr:ATP-binding protein [Candidatus Cloacimonadota bacterium]MDY0298307.1 ATP-binding protein [Candidatus Cloacimonadaceae bacterium]MCB5278962.1 ATP-binding protein [Candidatus Cloacimonadota bacterium]MCK9331708.1 ATP-binding protein [Candidatus Cloacimonadota bacterium]MDD3282971.1 ATP-binding protein [Candidatus Cloacimonadota bacterium]
MRIAIASGKGGTGKTTLAVNLALYAAEEFPVLLMDLDVEEPNGGIFIKGSIHSKITAYRNIPHWEQEPCTLCGKCTTWCAYNALLKLGDTILVMPNLCHSCYACSELCPEHALPMQQESLGTIIHIKNGSLNFVESKLDIGLEQASPLISQSLEFANKNFKDIKLQILDSPPGTACAMVSAVKTADYVVLISEPTPFGLHDLKLAVETVRQLNLPFSVVINRDGIGNNDIYKYLEQEGIELLAKIPHSREIAEIYSRGEILYKKVPQLRAALDRILHKTKERT